MNSKNFVSMPIKKLKKCSFTTISILVKSAEYILYFKITKIMSEGNLPFEPNWT